LKQLKILPPNLVHLRTQAPEEDMGLILILLQVAPVTNGRLLTLRPNMDYRDYRDYREKRKAFSQDG